MNEPTHSHFVLNDASYCHFLEDRLYIGKREVPAKIPAPKYQLDFVTLTLQLAGLAILLFFDVMTIMVHYYVVTFTLSALAATLMLSLSRTAGFTSTEIILKSDIVAVNYYKKWIGYDYFIVQYKGPNGKIWKRRLAIYDSHQCLEQALKAMHVAGLLK